MPEPVSFKQLVQKHKTVAEPVNQSSPTLALETPEEPVQEHEHVSIFHLVCAMQDMLHGIGELTSKVDALVKDNEKERNFVDTPAMLGATVGYTVNYQNRKFLFIYSAAAITLSASDGTTKAVTAHTWTNISYPRGYTLTISGGSDSSLTPVTIRACDFLLSTN